MRGIWKFAAAAFVNDVEVAAAELMVAPETGKPVAAAATGTDVAAAGATRGQG